MDDELLHFYDRELSHLRHMGAAFAREHPKIAGRLRLGTDQVEDPHVSRLIEAVAFLNARLRAKLDDEFPELSDALLSVLAPQYLAPIPSMSIVQLECASDLTTIASVPRGTMLESDGAYGRPCRYRTVYDVDVAPLAVRAARLLGPPFRAPSTPLSGRAAGVLHIQLQSADGKAAVGEITPSRLRFFLSGEFRHMAALYELVQNDVIEVAVGTSPEDPRPQVLSAERVLPVGFGDSEALLPDGARSHPGQRLLTEYFAFPYKFLFFDLDGIRAGDLDPAATSLNLFLFVRRASKDLEQVVKAENFALCCTPVVNLFERRAEPIRLSGTKTEYQLIADARYQLESEVYSVDAVRGLSRDGRKVEYAPFFGFNHELDQGGDGRYWFVSRRATPREEEDVDLGTELYISLVDRHFSPDPPPDWVLEAEVTCLNRNQPERLPFGGGHPKLVFSKGGGAITSIRCLTAPTATLRPGRGRGAAWRLISHLSLNHLSITGGERGGQALREILRLYEHSSAPESRNLIDSILSVDSRTEMRRIFVRGLPGFCTTTVVHLHLDEERLKASGVFLFAAVLERFLSGYCTLNSLLELVVTTNARKGELRRWKPRVGDRILG